MNYLCKYDTIKGVLIKECDNRFKGEALILDEQEIVYIPSSSKLNNFFDTNNIDALFVKTKSNKKYQYKLFACKNNWDEFYTVVDLSEINTILKKYYEHIYQNILSEKFINPRYKIDLFIPDEKIGIEIKTVFLNKNYIYPYHSTLRKVNQLKQIICLQKENYNIKYVFVINIKNKKIELDLKDKAFCKLFIEAQRNGLTIEEIWLSCNEVGEILLEKV